MPSLLRRLHNSWQVARAVHWGRAFERASRDEIEAHVSRRLSALVQFAAERVPHYRELFRREGIDPREIRTREDLRQLPVLEKQSLYAEPERLMPDGAQTQECFQATTSGTTGQATRVWFDLPGLWEGLGRAQRRRDKQALLVAPALARQPKMYVSTEHAIAVRKDRFYQEQLLLPRAYRASVVASELAPPEEIIARICQVRPRVIALDGAVLEILALHLRAQNSEVELPFVFTYSANAVSATARRLLEEGHGAKVLSSYSACEGRLMAYECEHRRLLHLAEDITLMRVCDEHGQDIEEGIGEVIITPLVNRRTVLINYRLGDRAEVTTERCPCGTAQRSLRRVEGRTTNLLVRPDGRLVSSMVLTELFSSVPEIVRYQFVQEELTRSQLQLVLRSEADLARVQRALDEPLRRRLGPDIKIEYESVAELPVGRKFEAVTSKVRPPGGMEERHPE